MTAYELWLSKAPASPPATSPSPCGNALRDKAAEQFRQIRPGGTNSFQGLPRTRRHRSRTAASSYHALALSKELGGRGHRPLRERGRGWTERQRELLAAGQSGPEFHEPSAPSSSGRGGPPPLHLREITGAPVEMRPQPAETRPVREAWPRRARGGRRQSRQCSRTSLSPELTPRSPAARETIRSVSPLRDKSQLDPRWSHLASRNGQQIATDHAPFDFTHPEGDGQGGVTMIPNAFPA